jgi:hypothetical protein
MLKRKNLWSTALLAAGIIGCVASSPALAGAAAAAASGGGAAAAAAASGGGAAAAAAASGGRWGGSAAAAAASGGGASAAAAASGGRWGGGSAAAAAASGGRWGGSAAAAAASGRRWGGSAAAAAAARRSPYRTFGGRSNINTGRFALGGRQFGSTLPVMQRSGTNSNSISPLRTTGVTNAVPSARTTTTKSLGGSKYWSFGKR